MIDIKVSFKKNGVYQVNIARSNDGDVNRIVKSFEEKGATDISLSIASPYELEKPGMPIIIFC